MSLELTESRSIEQRQPTPVRANMVNSLPILERLFQRECRSLAQYIGETWPWVQGADRPAKDLLGSILADERRWASQLADLITARRGQPFMGSYPDSFIHSNLHFVGMNYLMHRLADYLEPVIETLRADLKMVADDEPVRSLI